MTYIAPWKKFLIIFVCVLGFAYSLPNVLSQDTKTWMHTHLPSWMPSKTINLGLDLRGGAHLLYEVDVDVVFQEKAEAMVQDLRTELRQDKIGYSRISSIPNGVRVVLRNKEDAEATRKILRGSEQHVDVITGGDDLTIEAKLNDVGIKQIFDQTMSQSIEIVRRRVDELGTTEPIIQRQGDDRILIQAPGANAEQLKGIIGTTAKLNFHLVQDDNGGFGGSKSFPMAEDPSQMLAVQRRAMISGDMLTNAQPSFDQNGQPVISFRLDNTGARRFCEVSRDNVGKPFAIVLDNKILSAPVIREAICGGQGQISGGFSIQEATDLALLLRAGALPAPMKVIEERTVGPSLGADSVQAGKTASFIGFLFVFVFMLIAYGTFGFFAGIALIINVVLIFALLSMLQATLSLPGIAGIVLTFGMAVDANVLIYERIREELSAGRSPLASIEAGYKNAMATIVDSNLTTLIAAGILFGFGTGPIKGFAVTLSIGIITSMFSAIMITRLIIVAWMQKKKPKTLAI